MIAQLPLSPVSDDFVERQSYWPTEPSKGLVGDSELMVMREYSSPSRNPQADSATISTPPTPFTPPQGLRLVDLDFPDALFPDFAPSAEFPTPLSTTTSYWPDMSMIPTSTGQRQYTLLAPGSYSLPTSSAETPAYYSPALSSTAYPTFRSASRASYGQSAVHEDPCHHPAPYNFVSSQPNDRQTWLNNGLDMNVSRVGVGLLHSQETHSTSVSPSAQINPAAFSSPSTVLSNYPRPESRSASIILPIPPVQTSSSTGRKYFPLASTRRISKVKKRSPSVERRYTCPTCSRGFKKHSNLKDHEQKHDTDRLPPYLCNYEDCNKRLGRKTDLARHVNAVHKNEKGFVCDKCKKGFGRKDTLNRHIGACPFARTFGDLAGEPEHGHSSPMPGIASLQSPYYQ